MSVFTKTFKSIGRISSAFDAYNYATYAINAKFLEKRSITSKMLEDFMIANYPKYKFFPNNIKSNQKVYQANLKKGDKPYKINSTLGEKFDIVQEDNILYFNKDAKVSMLYVYGSTFWNDISIFQLNYIHNLAQALNIQIVVPLQGFAPVKEYTNVYYDILSVLAYKKITFDYIAGDGSGAIFIMNLFNDTNIKEEGFLDSIKNILLFSPLVNIQVDKLEGNKQDPITDPYTLDRQIRYFFKNREDDIKKYNPFNFRLSNLPKTLIVAADKDCLFKDQEQFYHRLKYYHNDVTFWKFDHMINCFNFYPLLESAQLMGDLKIYLTTQNKDTD